MLGEDVEGVADEAGRLDLTGVHPLDDDRGLDQVGAVLGEEAPSAGGPDLMSRTTDPLKPAGDRTRRLDLYDKVDSSHVDAQLQRARGDEAAEAACLEVVLDDEALLLAERSVVRSHEVAVGRWTADVLAAADLLVVGHLVQPARQALGEAAGVGEHDGGAV